jgi:hypothetical protein
MNTVEKITKEVQVAFSKRDVLVTKIEKLICYPLTTD